MSPEIKYSLSTYLAGRTRLSNDMPAAASIGRFGRRIVPSSLRSFAKMSATRAAAIQQRRKALRLQATGLTKLHLGCGGTNLPGWLNIDLFGTNADVYLDLRNGLPFSDASVDAIFHEHLIEHLSYADALKLTRECARVLKAGGVLRMAMPDFRRYAESYLSGKGLIDQKRPERPTRLLALSEVLYEHGHCSMWDPDTLRLLTQDAGFAEFQLSSFGQSSLGDIDSASRQLESIYVEASK